MVLFWVSQGAPVVKNSPANAGRLKRCEFDPWGGKFPWRKAQPPTLVFLPGESHAQSLAVHRVTQSQDTSEVTWHTHKFYFKRLV